MSGDYVLTCKTGDNSDLFPDILQLYVPKGSFVLDMTWGNGVFWKQVSWFGGSTDNGRFDYAVVCNDKDKGRGDVHFDFRALPEEWTEQFDATVLDPPYLYTGGFKTLKDSIDKGYKNRKRNEEGINGVKAVDKLYYDGMTEAFRVLKPKGILIVKCQDQVMSGEQVWGHVTYGEYGVALGFRQEDLFVLHQDHQPLMRHPPELQQHARRNHSYFLVFRKRRIAHVRQPS